MPTRQKDGMHKFKAPEVYISKLPEGCKRDLAYIFKLSGFRRHAETPARHAIMKSVSKSFGSPKTIILTDLGSTQPVTA